MAECSRDFAKRQNWKPSMSVSDEGSISHMIASGSLFSSLANAVSALSYSITSATSLLRSSATRFETALFFKPITQILLSDTLAPNRSAYGASSVNY